jgi:EmrB/QacA subfamily drug resistance transporter
MLVPLVVACALFMETLDSTIITTALPAIAESFGTSAAHLSLAVTAYMLSIAVFIPISGWVADRYGARTIFRLAIGVFTLGSVCCGLSNGFVELVAARILQGLGGAMMVPVGRLVLLRSVAKADLVQAMAYVTIPGVAGPVIGPPLGGLITTYLSWRWIFFLNVPIGILGIVLVSLVIKNYRETARPPLDWGGFFLTGIAVTCLIYALDQIARGITGAALWSFVGIGLAVGTLAVLHSRFHAHPLIDLTLLRVPTFAIQVVGGSVFRIAAGAVPFLLPLLLQLGFGMTAFVSGILTFAAGAGSFAMKVSARPFLRRFGFRRILIGNGIISALSILACSFFTQSTPAVAIFAVLLVGGFFRSLQFTAFNTIAYADIATSRISAATSFASMAQSLANGTGVAVGAVILQIALMLRGVESAAPSVLDMQYAFAVCALLCASSVLLYLGLAPDAGVEVSGHGRRP